MKKPMTLTVNHYAVRGEPPAKKVGWIRWTEGKFETSGGRWAEWILATPIVVEAGGPQIFATESARETFCRGNYANRIVDPQRFVRGLHRAYSARNGYSYCGPAHES